MKTFTEIETILNDINLMNKMLNSWYGTDKYYSYTLANIILSRLLIKLNKYPGSWVNAVRIIIQLRNQKDLLKVIIDKSKELDAEQKSHTVTNTDQLRINSIT